MVSDPVVESRLKSRGENQFRAANPERLGKNRRLLRQIDQHLEKKMNSNRNIVAENEGSEPLC